MNAKYSRSKNDHRLLYIRRGKSLHITYDNQFVFYQMFSGAGQLEVAAAIIEGLTKQYQLDAPGEFEAFKSTITCLKASLSKGINSPRLA